MTIPLYQVDAFTDVAFSGNPAAVCPLDTWLPDNIMQSIAAENNLSETAFFIPAQGETDYAIRWFTPTDEVPLCGHATLAAAHVIFYELHHASQNITLKSASGILKVSHGKDGLTLDFPKWNYERVETLPALQKALGTNIAELYKGEYWMAVLENEGMLRQLKPDLQAVLKTPAKHLIVTAPSSSVDFVSRCFFPSIGVNEDPVTGSAHCILTPYWAERLKQDTLTAKQISKRGGALTCRLNGDRVLIGGKTVLYMKGEIICEN